MKIRLVAGVSDSESSARKAPRRVRRIVSPIGKSAKETTHDLLSGDETRVDGMKAPQHRGTPRSPCLTPSTSTRRSRLIGRSLPCRRSSQRRGLRQEPRLHEKRTAAGVPAAQLATNTATRGTLPAFRGRREGGRRPTRTWGPSRALNYARL